MKKVLPAGLYKSPVMMLKSAVFVRELQGQYDVQYEYVGAGQDRSSRVWISTRYPFNFRGFKASCTHQTIAIAILSRFRCGDISTLWFI